MRSTSSVYIVVRRTHRASLLRTGVRTGVHPPLRFCCVTMATCEGWNEPLGLFLPSSHPRPLSEQKSWLRAIETEIGLGPEGEKVIHPLLSHIFLCAERLKVDFGMEKPQPFAGNSSFLLFLISIFFFSCRDRIARKCMREGQFLPEIRSGHGLFFSGLEFAHFHKFHEAFSCFVVAIRSSLHFPVSPLMNSVRKKWQS